MTPTTFTVQFHAIVLDSHINHGIKGYLIGSVTCRSITTLTTTLTKAFEKDLGTYRKLGATISFNIGSETRKAYCESTDYTTTITAINSELTYTALTIDDLLE